LEKEKRKKNADKEGEPQEKIPQRRKDRLLGRTGRKEIYKSESCSEQRGDGYLTKKRKAKDRTLKKKKTGGKAGMEKNPLTCNTQPTCRVFAPRNRNGQGRASAPYRM